jgi:hypothetical protein
VQFAALKIQLRLASVFGDLPGEVRDLLVNRAVGQHPRRHRQPEGQARRAAEKSFQHVSRPPVFSAPAIIKAALWLRLRAFFACMYGRLSSLPILFLPETLAAGWTACRTLICNPL